MDQVLGKVTIAPTVLTTIVRLTTLEQRGVRRLSALPQKMRGLKAGSAMEEGLLVEATDDSVLIEVHIVADADANLLRLGEALQTGITRAIEEMAGTPVAKVDVFIDDVVLPATPAE